MERRAGPRENPLYARLLYAGAGHIVTAQTLAGRRRIATDQWQSIVATLPEVTGRYATETINHVNRIEQHFDRLTAMESKR